MKRWFSKDEEFDKMLLENFEADIINFNEAKQGASIDAILLHDQVTRNIYRGTPKSFSGDAIGQRLAKSLLPNLMEMPIYEAAFALMPLMHSEKLEDHKICLEMFTKLHEKCTTTNNDAADAMAYFIKFEKDHVEPIEKFGRYPSRNAILGRESTPEELQYLENHKGW